MKQTTSTTKLPTWPSSHDEFTTTKNANVNSYFPAGLTRSLINGRI